jgi:hypothetical protein
MSLTSSRLDISITLSTKKRVSQKGILFFFPDILPPSGYWLRQKSQLAYKTSLKKSKRLQVV